jgi:hypothetical protein
VRDEVELRAPESAVCQRVVGGQAKISGLRGVVSTTMARMDL